MEHSEFPTDARAQAAQQFAARSDVRALVAHIGTHLHRANRDVAQAHLRLDALQACARQAQMRTSADWVHDDLAEIESLLHRASDVIEQALDQLPDPVEYARRTAARRLRRSREQSQLPQQASQRERQLRALPHPPDAR